MKKIFLLVLLFGAVLQLKAQRVSDVYGKWYFVHPKGLMEYNIRFDSVKTKLVNDNFIPIGGGEKAFKVQKYSSYNGCVFMISPFDKDGKVYYSGASFCEIVKGKTIQMGWNKKVKPSDEVHKVEVSLKSNASKMKGMVMYSRSEIKRLHTLPIAQNASDQQLANYLKELDKLLKENVKDLEKLNVRKDFKIAIYQLKVIAFEKAGICPIMNYMESQQLDSKLRDLPSVSKTFHMQEVEIKRIFEKR